MKRRLIHYNPCQVVSPPKSITTEPYPPDAQAVHQFLAAARSTEYYEAMYTAFFTGLRRGELLALSWRDIDLEAATISIIHSVYRARGSQSIYHEPRTQKGRGLVDLTPSTALLLRSLRERQEADGQLLGYDVDKESPVYHDGSPFLPRSFSGAFTKIMRRAGLEGFKLHQARHSHASLLLRQGENPKLIQERLWHSKVGTTLDIYSHVTPDLHLAATLRIEEVVAEARQPEPISELLVKHGQNKSPRRGFGGFFVSRKWSGRWDSNPRPSPWQGDALPLSHFRTGSGLPRS